MQDSESAGVARKNVNKGKRGIFEAIEFHEKLAMVDRSLWCFYEKLVAISFSQ